MRIIDVVLLSVILGTAALLLPTWQGRAAGLPGAPPERAGGSVCERLVWLRAPALHARRGVQ
jgi:hypothetical protein